MARFRLSQLAETDLIAIADYTLEAWGEEQVYRYLAGLEECFELLAESPGIGRMCDTILSGYRRFEHEKHVIFYRTDKAGVFISRILHERVLPRPHLLDQSDS